MDSKLFHFAERENLQDFNKGRMASFHTEIFSIAALILNGCMAQWT